MNLNDSEPSTVTTLPALRLTLLLCVCVARLVTVLLCVRRPSRGLHSGYNLNLPVNNLSNTVTQASRNGHRSSHCNTNVVALASLRPLARRLAALPVNRNLNLAYHWHPVPALPLPPAQALPANSLDPLVDTRVAATVEAAASGSACGKRKQHDRLLLKVKRCRYQSHALQRGRGDPITDEPSTVTRRR